MHIVCSTHDIPQAKKQSASAQCFSVLNIDAIHFVYHITSIILGRIIKVHLLYLFFWSLKAVPALNWKI